MHADHAEFCEDKCPGSGVSEQYSVSIYVPKGLLFIGIPLNL